MYPIFHPSGQSTRKMSALNLCWHGPNSHIAAIHTFISHVMDAGILNLVSLMISEQ